MTKPTPVGKGPQVDPAPNYKLWNVPQSDPFIGQPAFVVRQGSHDAIYSDYVALKNASPAGRAALMTNANDIPLYAG